MYYHAANEKISFDIVDQILCWCHSKPRRDGCWFSQGGAQVHARKPYQKTRNLFSLAYFHRRKKPVSEIIQPDPWGEGEKSRSKGGSFWCSQQPQDSLGAGGESGPGRAGTRDPRLDGAHWLTSQQSDEQSLSGTKDICWVKQELTQNKDKARQYHMTRQSVPARCQGQRQLMHPISQEESIMLNNSVSSIWSKSVQMQLKRALRSAHCRLKSDWSPSCDMSALAAQGSHSCGKMSFQARYMHKAGLNMDVCYPSFFFFFERPKMGGEQGDTGFLETHTYCPRKEAV